MNILILGCGNIGLALAIQLQQQGHQVTNVSRNAKIVTGIQHITQNIQQLQLDDTDCFDWVYVIVTPQHSNVTSYQNIFIDTARPVFQALHNHPVQRVVFVSSTRVYGEDTGQWIDDSVIPSTQDPIGQCLIAAEQLWSAYWQERLTIIRPSGLYQDGESPYLTHLAVNCTEIRSKHWTNRLHRQDLVGFLAFLLQIGHLESSYIMSDLQPTLQHAMINAIRQKHQLPTLTIADTLMETGKRLIPKRMQNTGYVLQHPSDQRFFTHSSYSTQSN